VISCTEFIPLYSEFFKFLEERFGEKSVTNFWIYISDNSIGDLSNPNSLGYKCEMLGGFEGAKAYWGHTLTEEACDLFELTDNKKRFRYSHMRHCPSRGMLNELKHIIPYHNYCEHCNIIYSRVLEKYGIVYERDNSNIANAECRSVFYEKYMKPDFDFRLVTDEEMYKRRASEDVDILDMKTEDNKYLHRDFHLLCDLALKYCGEKYGYAVVIEFITTYIKNYYSPIISEIKQNGLSSVKEWIENIYKTEEASYLLHISFSPKKLQVKIDHSPAIEYMRTLGQEPSKYYIEETRTLYRVIAEECGYSFILYNYSDNGAAEFSFLDI